MTVDQRIQYALSKRKEGYNCSQCMVWAFEDLVGDHLQSLLIASAPFGGGYSGARQMCGVIAGLGIVSSVANWTKPSDKAKLYASVTLDRETFAKRYNTTTCRELKQNGHDCAKLISDGIRQYCSKLGL